METYHKNLYKEQITRVFIMNAKKRILGFLAGFMVYFGINLVSAQWGSWGSFYNFQQGPSDLIEIVKNFFSPFFEAILGVGQYDQYFFARILLLLLIYVLVYAVLKEIDLIGDRPFILFIIAAVVAILGARYIGEINFIEGILLPYGALTIALSVLLPFIIFFWFVHSSMAGSGVARRAAWIFFAVIFFGLWLSRRTLTQFDWIYNVAIAAVVLAVIFDPKIHEYFEIEKHKGVEQHYLTNELMRLDKDLKNYEATYEGVPRNKLNRAVREEIERLEKRRKEVLREMGS